MNSAELSTTDDRYILFQLCNDPVLYVNSVSALTFVCVDALVVVVFIIIVRPNNLIKREAGIATFMEHLVCHVRFSTAVRYRKDTFHHHHPRLFLTTFVPFSATWPPCASA